MGTLHCSSQHRHMYGCVCSLYTIGTLHYTTSTFRVVSVSSNTLDHTTGTCWAVSVFSNTSDHTTGICWPVSVSSNILDHSTGTCWPVSVSSNILDLPQAHVSLCVFPVTHSILHCGQSSLGHGVIIQVQAYNMKTRLADSENRVLMHVRCCKHVCMLTCMFPKQNKISVRQVSYPYIRGPEDVSSWCSY